MQLTHSLALLASLASLAFAAPADTPGQGLPNQCPIRPSTPQPAPKRNPNLKITIPIYKLDEVSNAEFDRRWTKCNIPLALDCPAFTENVVKFSAIHNTPALRAELSALGYPTLAYDGIIEFWVKDLDHWQKVTASECWQTVRKDAQAFTKWPYQFMYGYEEVALDNTVYPL